MDCLYQLKKILLLKDAEMVECASTTSSTLEDQSLVMVSHEVSHGELVSHHEDVAMTHHEVYEGDLVTDNDLVTSDSDLVAGARVLQGDIII